MAAMDENPYKAEEQKLVERLHEKTAGHLSQQNLADLDLFKTVAGMAFPKKVLNYTAPFKTKDGKSRRVFVYEDSSKFSPGVAYETIIVTDDDYRPLYWRAVSPPESLHLLRARVDIHPSGTTLVLERSVRFSGTDRLEHRFALESSDLTNIETRDGPNREP
jgi:hypothetical protein